MEDVGDSFYCKNCDEKYAKWGGEKTMDSKIKLWLIKADDFRKELGMTQEEDMIAATQYFFTVWLAANTKGMKEAIKVALRHERDEKP